MQATKKSRTLKVYSVFSPRAFSKQIYLPQIKLSGIWLQNVGFRVGENIQITTSRGKLIISKKEVEK